MKCQGRRDNGEIFLAHIWFSAYRSPGGKRLAAIVVDSSEEMRDREEEGLHHLLTGNQIATAAIAHEVRNVSEAMAMLCEDLRRRHDLAQDTALRGLDSLVGGLEAIASFELQAGPHEVDEVPLREVLDNFRIVIEPAWREIDGVVRVAGAGRSAVGEGGAARPLAGLFEPGAEQPSRGSGANRPRASGRRIAAGAEGDDSISGFRSGHCLAGASCFVRFSREQSAAGWGSTSRDF